MIFCGYSLKRLFKERCRDPSGQNVVKTITHKSCHTSRKTAKTRFIFVICTGGKWASAIYLNQDQHVQPPYMQDLQTHYAFQCLVRLREREQSRAYLIHLRKLRADASELLLYTLPRWERSRRGIDQTAEGERVKKKRKRAKKLYQLRASYFNLRPVVSLTVVSTVICANPKLEFPSVCGGAATS